MSFQFSVLSLFKTKYTTPSLLVHSKPFSISSKSQPPVFHLFLLYKRAVLLLKTKGNWSLFFHISLCPIHLFFLSILLNLSYVYTHGPQFMHYFSEHMAPRKWWRVSFFLFTCLSVRMDKKFAEVTAMLAQDGRHMQFRLRHERCAWLLCKSKGWA